MAPHPHADDDPHVLLSSLEETVSIDDRTWQLDTHRYPSLYYPEGYKLIKSFKASPLPLWTFKAGKTEIRKSLAMTEHNVLLLKYEFRGPQRIAKLRIKPLLAFRNAHWLRQASTQISHEVVSLHDGVKLQPFDDYGPLYLHFSEQAAFTPEPCWYYQVEYRGRSQTGLRLS
ncbi:glycogen debranching enzyme N-terminal domain-containing protein [Chitinophaga sedimenti]|nr:glycogen debranching enzyme N-terminal domain-containing protein [Chitinophaga sedimenti]